VRHWRCIATGSFDGLCHLFECAFKTLSDSSGRPSRHRSDVNSSSGQSVHCPYARTSTTRAGVTHVAAYAARYALVPHSIRAWDWH
jgi:hypothetical protein